MYKSAYKNMIDISFRITLLSVKSVKKFSKFLEDKSSLMRRANRKFNSSFKIKFDHKYVSINSIYLYAQIAL